jgi:hypothetical protein
MGHISDGSALELLIAEPRHDVSQDFCDFGRAKIPAQSKVTMQRFRELIVGIRERYPSDAFFADFEDSCRLAIKRKHYRCYNDAMMLLDDESWRILREKAIEHFGTERKGQQKQGFFNQLNEAFAFRYLLRRGFEDIRFIKETKAKTPDISFVDRGMDSYCEVKTVGISDDEIERRATRGVIDCGVYFNLSAGFQRKLSEDIDRAWEQIRAAGENGIVFILVRFDDIALHHHRRYRQQLTEFCRTRGFENLVIKIDHRGNRGIRIKHKLAVNARGHDP